MIVAHPPPQHTVTIEIKGRGTWWQMGRASRVDARVRETQEWAALAAIVATGIRREREKRGVSMAELTAAMGVGDRQICRWERGDCVPSIETILAISLALGCSIGDLLPTEVRGVYVNRRDGAERAREERRRHTLEHIRAARGNVSEAARLAGIGRAAMTKRIERHGLRRELRDLRGGH